MKRKVVILIIILCILTASFISYDKYTDKKKEYYLKYITRIPMDVQIMQIGEEIKKVEEIRTIKKTPSELIMIVKIGDDKAYFRVESWLTKAGDEIDLHFFDKKRWLKAYE